MYNQYFTDRDQLEVSVYDKLLAQINNEIDSSLLENLPYISFIMLKPDSYMRGLTPDILKFIEGKNIYPIHLSLVTMTGEQINELYMFVKQKYFDTWWVMEKTYTTAPCLPVMLIGDKEGYDHLSQRIRDIIGPTTPIVGDNTQIRYSFNATHRVFNLVHGTDDPGSAIREALVFFSVQQIKEALIAAGRFRDGETPARYRLTDQVVPKEVLDIRFSNVKHSIKKKIITNIQESVSNLCSQTINNLIQKLFLYMAQEKEVIDRNLPLREERELLSDTLRNEIMLMALLQENIEKLALSDIRKADTSNEGKHIFSKLIMLIDLVTTITDEIRMRYSNFEMVISSMRLTGVDISSHEEIIMHTGWAVNTQEVMDFYTKL